MTATPFWFWEARIDKASCDAFISEYYNPEKAVAGQYMGPNGEYITGDKRETKVCWADPMSPLAVFLFNHILLTNLKTGWNFDVDQMQNIQIGEYSVGGHYDWHEDEATFARNAGGTQRKISVSMLLSDPDSYEGGDLLFHGSNKPLTRKQGSIIVFPSCLVHTVTPVTKGVRYSAVGWSIGPNFR